MSRDPYAFVEQHRAELTRRLRNACTDTTCTMERWLGSKDIGGAFFIVGGVFLIAAFPSGFKLGAVLDCLIFIVGYIFLWRAWYKYKAAVYEYVNHQHTYRRVITDYCLRSRDDELEALWKEMSTAEQMDSSCLSEYASRKNEIFVFYYNLIDLLLRKDFGLEE